MRDLGSIPRLGRSPEEGKGYPVQYSGLENFRDCIVHGVAKSQAQVSNFHFTLLVPFDVQVFLIQRFHSFWRLEIVETTILL